MLAPPTVVDAETVVYPVEDALTVYALLEVRFEKNACPHESVVEVAANPVRVSHTVIPLKSCVFVAERVSAKSELVVWGER